MCMCVMDMYAELTGLIRYADVFYIYDPAQTLRRHAHSFSWHMHSTVGPCIMFKLE